MHLDKVVSQMRDLATVLMQYSFPQVPAHDEETISCLKQREILVDGYDLVVYFNKCRHVETDMESIQVFGKYFTFLPFAVVCKVARRFLGDKELSLIEMIHNQNGVLDEFSRKIYVWTVYYNGNEPVAGPFVGNFETKVYNGLKFSHVDHSQINFF